MRVRVVPSLAGRSAQVERSSGVILAPPQDPTLRDPGVWLHEVAHIEALGKRPTEPIARRIFRAVEEGAADFYAASVGGSATLGVVEGRAERDLSQRVKPHASEWSALALGAADPHRFGWALASQLWASFGADATLAEDLLRGLASLEPGRDAGAASLRALFRAIPQRSRARLVGSLLAWLPPELQPTAHTENNN